MRKISPSSLWPSGLKNLTVIIVVKDLVILVILKAKVIVFVKTIW